MRSRWIAVALSLAMLLSACQTSKKKRIAVIPKGTSHIFWLTVRAGAEAAGQKFGVEILWNGPPQETEYDRQIQIVDSMLAQRVDGMAVAATERKALNRSLDRAAELGIPVTVFDSGVDSTNYMTFLATNNYEGGKMGARELAGLVGGQGKVAMVMHAPGSASTMDRERGFEDVIKSEFPKIEIVARQYSMSDPSKGRAAAENILSAHSDLNGIFASSEPSSLGVTLALKSRGLSGKVKCVTFDSSDQLIEDLKGGTIDAMVVQDPFKMGFEAVKTLVDKLNGVTSPKQIDLPARLVKKEDLDKPDVHALLYPDVKKYTGLSLTSPSLKSFNSSAKSEFIAIGGVLAVGVDNHLPRRVENCCRPQTLPVGNIEAAVHFGEAAITLHLEWRLFVHN